jgi:thioesterase DpgC
MSVTAASVSALLRAVGFGASAVAEWLASEPRAIADYDGDCRRYSHFWARSYDLVASLPPKPARSEAETAAAAAIFALARDHRERFLSAHGEAVYDRLTHARSRFIRLEELVFEAATAIPGLMPTREQIGAQADRHQRDKDGLEIDQGMFLSHMLASERAGRHLCHAMLLPRPETAELLAKLDADAFAKLARREDASVEHAEDR